MEKENLLRAFVDSIPDPVVIADKGHKIIHVNRAARDLFEGGDRLSGRSLLECHNEDSKRKLAEVLEALDTGGKEEVQITEKPGQRTFMRAVRDESGNLLGYYERYVYFPKRVD
jgi:PAS domain S-box-containing protein